jgi:hypothetical protein
VTYKPLDEKTYLSHLRIVGWHLKKGHVDWNLVDEHGAFICTIKIAHGKKIEKGVVARSVHRTEKEFKKRGWAWPPRKKK